MKHALSLALGLAMSSCATIVDGGPDAIPIDTIPPGAAVYLDGAHVGTTPCTIVADRSLEGEIRLELDGYLIGHDRLQTTMNGWFLGNFILGGLIGIVVDMASGDITKFSERRRVVELTPVSLAAE